MARNKTRFTVTIDPQVLDGAREKSEETSVPISAVVERFLAYWVRGGTLPPKVVKSGAAADEEKPAKRRRS